MTIKHSLPSIQNKLRKLDAKITKFAKWSDVCDYDMGIPQIVGYTTKGIRIGRRYDRIAEKYGII